MNKLKRISIWALKQCIRLFLSILPFSITRRIISGSPRLALCMPRDIKTLVHDYLGDITILIDSRYPVEREILSGIYDLTLNAIIRKFTHEGDVCLDVGANIGAVSFALARSVGPTGCVYSFEPGPPLFARFQKNLELNPVYLSIIKPFRLGIADRTSFLYWREAEHYPGSGGCVGVIPGEGARIEMTSIDEFCFTNHIDHVDFLKIDVEGMELEAIQGGIRMIGRDRPLIYYETRKEFEDLRGRKIFFEIEQILSAMGYSFYTAERKGHLVEVRYPDLTYNTIAVHLQFLPSVPGPLRQRQYNGTR